MLVALAAGTCLSEAAACSERDTVGAVRDAAASHFAAFERFERWAERSVSSDVRLQGEQALRETVFAPLRGAREVVWAEVRVDARQVLTYRTPLADVELRFTPIEAPTLGRVQVALCPACASNKAERECVVIARAAGRRHAEVRIAFCSTEPEATTPGVATPSGLKPIASSKARATQPTVAPVRVSSAAATKVSVARRNVATVIVKPTLAKTGVTPRELETAIVKPTLAKTGVTPRELTPARALQRTAANGSVLKPPVAAEASRDRAARCDAARHQGSCR